MLPLVLMDKVHETNPGIPKKKKRFRFKSAALCFCLMMAATHSTAQTSHTLQTAHLG